MRLVLADGRRVELVAGGEDDHVVVEIETVHLPRRWAYGKLGGLERVSEVLWLIPTIGAEGVVSLAMLDRVVEDARCR